jgi:hypothetical protein
MRYGVPLQIETKRLDGDEWLVEGYASTYDRDLGDDVVVPGAFQKSLGGARPVRFLYSHDPSQVLGTVLDLKEDERGLRVSLVSMPMNPAAVVTGVKALDGVALQQAMSAYVADAEARKRAEAVERPIEAILDDALRAVKALCERRRADGREPSERTVAAVGAYREALLTSAAELAAAVVGEPVEVAPEAPEPAEAKAEAVEGEATEPTQALAGAGLVERHQRRKRISALIAKYREKDDAA